VLVIVVDLRAGRDYDDRQCQKARRKKSPSLLFALYSFALGFAANAQQPKKVPRIGYLSAFDQLLSPPDPRQFGLAAMWMSSH